MDEVFNQNKRKRQALPTDTLQAAADAGAASADNWSSQQQISQRQRQDERHDEQVALNVGAGQDSAEAAQDMLAESLTQVQAGLLQEPPQPMAGVRCDLPPAPVELAVRQTEPLSAQALAVLAQQEATLYDQHLRLMRFDDALAELASRRGLLVRFYVRSIRAYQAEAELVVEAPECMTVEYLKRRVVKAKLQRGDKLLSTARFMLRKPVYGSQTVAQGVDVLCGMEELPSTTPGGDELFLFHLGYRAPGPYELYITTASQASDREQQEALVASLMSQAQDRQRQRQQAATMAAATSMAAQPAEVVDARLNFQSLLDSPAVLSAHRREEQRSSPSAAQFSAARTQYMLAAHAAQTAATAANAAVTAAAASTNLGGEERRGRRHLGRWTAEEVAELIAGVQEHGTRWTSIFNDYVRTGRINPGRTQVDLKDKWRNLVRLACDPGRQARSKDLTDEQRQTVWSIVFPATGTHGSHDIAGNGNVKDQSG